MAETDLSKIVGLIMDNPHLIEEIKKMSAGTEPKTDETESRVLQESTDDVETPSSFDITHTASERGASRKELLRALKPYLSEERGRAIDTMMSIADILDMMRQR